MSDVMLLGVLRMPPSCWDPTSEFDAMQRHSRYVEAAERIERDADQIARLLVEAREAMAAIWHEANVSPMSARTRTRLKTIALKLADDQSGFPLPTTLKDSP